MATCSSCGGVLGRDCFNPQECAEITQQMEHQANVSLEQRVQYLEEEVAALRRQLPDNR